MSVERENNSAHSHGHLDAISSLRMQGGAFPFTQGRESACAQVTNIGADALMAPSIRTGWGLSPFIFDAQIPELRFSDRQSPSLLGRRRGRVLETKYFQLRHSKT